MSEEFTNMTPDNISHILTGDSIGRIDASDCDANSPFNVLRYFRSQDSNSLAKEYFDIGVNGEVYVRKSLISDSQDTLVYTVSYTEV